MSRCRVCNGTTEGWATGVEVEGALWEANARWYQAALAEFMDRWRQAHADREMSSMTVYLVSPPEETP